ncbi:hypothetical protein D3C76_1071990 [compost metagenome]
MGLLQGLNLLLDLLQGDRVAVGVLLQQRLALDQCLGLNRIPLLFKLRLGLQQLPLGDQVGLQIQLRHLLCMGNVCQSGLLVGAELLLFHVGDLLLFFPLDRNHLRGRSLVLLRVLAVEQPATIQRLLRDL